MSAFSLSPFGIRAIRAVGLFGGLLCCLAAAEAQDLATVEAQLDQHLSAGEFVPARALADSIDDVARRDALLGRIARMQAAGGAARGSFRTLADMGSDRMRTDAIDAIRSTPLGGGAGGAALADFDTLIELITSTVNPDSWEENGGNGAIEPFPTGVFVDAEGVLRRIEATDPQRLDSLRRRAAVAGGNRNVRLTSELRKVSLNRLEKQIQLRWLAGQSADETMRNLAGIHHVQYVLLYPDTGDIVLAGPAGDWQETAEGSVINSATHEPVLQLDDFIVLLRQARGGGETFGCAITPRQENLAAAQTFLAEWSTKELKPTAREKWLEDLRSTVGRQDVEVFGLDSRTRVARILVEADYRMKLVGIGLEEGTLGVTNYLDLVTADKKEPAEMSVLRWWFAMHYDAVRTNTDRTAFELAGQSVRVLSENEMLAERGERLHTGASEEKNQQFANSFTTHFGELSQKYPIYAELRNVFDLALVANIIEREGLADRADWHLTHFDDPQRYAVPLAAAPKEVDSVVNYRTVNRRKFVAAVSGGVRANPLQWVSRDAMQEDSSGTVAYAHLNASPQEERLPPDAWWWD